ncbi:SPFH domain-containing protein [Lachnoclostridium phytofermentans]|uniref:Antifreeze protein type I n=1 Tax=Lachnoclostridium phytofermentans (strain ATCC 700394 / DSM 18823 / ISDg) TaxID=357809 RepID=A9KKC7_LACP7|nr:SPFH domain-containing protein [Lachnoclostridium phytofermentans]ABX44118.1 antifreeze protein type I [Lachnoclostridium phytofermentans ISDg]
MAIVEVVKYDGAPNVFAWKYPNNELGTWTQLIVNESQEAVLFKGGKALDVFGGGRHTLETANIPLLNNIINLPFGRRSPFSAEVWYVNKVYSLNIKWGTTSPIQIQDPKYGIFIPVRSYGQFGIRIEDSKKFLIKLVGTLNVFDDNNILQYFRGLYLTMAKDTISSYLIQKKISVLEINAYLDEMSNYIVERIKPTMDEYGIGLTNFYVNDINVPEEDTAVKKLKDALAKRAEMNIIGYDYQQQRSFDTLESAASNQGGVSSGIMGAGMGLGMGINVGNAIGTQFGSVSNALNTKGGNKKECVKCHAAIEAGTRFCPSCGNDTSKTESENSNTIKCDNCGAFYSANTKFCPECGNRYNPCPNCKADIPDGATNCSSCGYELPIPCPGCGNLVHSKKHKFCPECGTPLVKKCPKCETVIEGSPKFCPECGEKLS